MSNGIPKSARDLLAKQTAADAHPSPDLLNAFVEQALTEAEKQQVTLHLASCADCREVVFLVSSPLAEELEPALVVAAPPRSLRPEAAPARPTEQPQGCAVLEPRPKRPSTWWKWALPLTAIVVLGATALVERDRMTSRLGTLPTETAAVKQKAASSTSIAAPAVPANPTANPAIPVASEASSQTSNTARNHLAAADRANPALASRIDAAEQARVAKSAKPESNQLMFQAQLASKVESPRSNALAATVASAPRAAAKASPSSPSTSQSEEVTSAAPLVQADNSDLGVNTPADLKTQAMAKSLTADQLGSLTTLEMERSPSPAKTRWRISRDGHVEHTVSPSTWERVMSAEPVTFRVVASVGNNVWAGGSDGALFHSSDGGRHWERVALAGEQGAITSIHFSTTQQGSLSSDSGATWTTTDGGFTWSKQ